MEDDSWSSMPSGCGWLAWCDLVNVTGPRIDVDLCVLYVDTLKSSSILGAYDRLPRVFRTIWNWKTNHLEGIKKNNHTSVLKRC